jgi:hypothetical protein
MRKVCWDDSPATQSSVAAQAPRSREERNKHAALYHANILQHQKDTESLILESLEKLIDFPSSPDSNPAQPSPEDVHILKDALTLFQPSDYGSLIEERNINRLCGYALCPRPNQLQPTSADRIIVRDRGKVWDPLKVVNRKALEQWCSDGCGKRALFLKVQLHEEPVWERLGRDRGNITLFGETGGGQIDEVAEKALAVKLGRFNISDEDDRLLRAMQELAIERGVGKTGHKSSRLVDVNITEKVSSEGQPQPLPDPGHSLASHHCSVEGYIPRGSALMAQSRPNAGEFCDHDDKDDLSEIIHNY